jgi:hypothetical protein
MNKDNPKEGFKHETEMRSRRAKWEQQNGRDYTEGRMWGEEEKELGETEINGEAWMPHIKVKILKAENNSDR